MALIAVVDDESNIRSTLKDILEDMHHQVQCYPTGEAFMASCQEQGFDLVFIDIRMPGKSGLEVLEWMRLKGVDSEVVVFSGHGNIDTAVQAVKLGAFDFVQKPLSLEKMEITTKRALERRSANEALKEWRDVQKRRLRMVGKSPAMENLRKDIMKAAPINCRVLILGESGTGKELVAHAIHHQSLRVNGPFIKLNCAAIPENLIESELFGHEKGSFTGAIATKKGKFELAHGGTIFLDEIGDMAPSVQAKVLRLLEESELERVGGAETIKVDVRVLAATHKNLEKLVEENKFRQDLFFRLNVLQIKVPPLRSREEDIPELAETFLFDFCHENQLPMKKLSEASKGQLRKKPYPGNVRELKNLVERLAILSDGNELILEEKPEQRDVGIEKNSLFSIPRSLAEAKQELEKIYVQTQLKQNDWDISKTAESLQIERTNLYRKIKQLNIEIP